MKNFFSFILTLVCIIFAELNIFAASPGMGDPGQKFSGMVLIALAASALILIVYLIMKLIKKK